MASQQFFHVLIDIKKRKEYLKGHLKEALLQKINAVKVLVFVS